jgi:hypothetical protein
MYTIISRDRLQLSAGTVVRMPGSWQDYRFLCQSRGDSSIPRIKYRQGEILLMSPMPKHGRDANNLADITIHVDCDNYGIVEDAHMAILHSLIQTIRKSYAHSPETLRL